MPVQKIGRDTVPLHYPPNRPRSIHSSAVLSGAGQMKGPNRRYFSTVVRQRRGMCNV